MCVHTMLCRLHVYVLNQYCPSFNYRWLLNWLNALHSMNEQRRPSLLSLLGRSSLSHTQAHAGGKNNRSDWCVDLPFIMSLKISYFTCFVLFYAVKVHSMETSFSRKEHFHQSRSDLKDLACIFNFCDLKGFSLQLINFLNNAAYLVSSSTSR